MNIPPDRLYNLLPAVYRIRDSAQGEPLRALMGIIQSELEAIDEDISRLYDNWFIETCQEWVVPYIADLLGVRSLKPISGGTFTARPFVAHALKYRRSKGTAAMLEGLAHDVTNWPSRVVEFFELLDTTQHLNHLRTDHVVTPDFRDTNALELLSGPFGQANHTLDVRSVALAGKYDVPNVGIYLWRLESFPLTRSTACPVTDGTDGRYRFSPLNIDTPLFNQPTALADGARVVTESQVPGLLRRRALYDDLEALRQAIVDGTATASVDGIATTSIFFRKNPVLQIFVADTPVPPEQIIICDLSDQPTPPGSWPQPPASVQYTPSSGGPKITRPITVSVDPLLGRLFFTTGSIPQDRSKVHVSYSYAFSGNLGGGPYDRTDSMPAVPAAPFVQVAVTKQLTADNRTIFATLTDAIENPTTGWNAQAPGTSGIIAILDSETYADSPSITIPDRSTLLIVAADWPGLRDGDSSRTALEPAGNRPSVLGHLQVTGTAAPSSNTPGGLTLNGLLIDGGVTVEPGNLGSLALVHCTLVPAAGGLQVAAQVQTSTLHTALAHTAAATAPVLTIHPNGGPPPPPPRIRITTTSPLPTATTGAPYSKAFGATGDTGFTWSADGLPAGLSMSADGILSGTPQTAGTFNLSVSVDSAGGGSASRVFALPVTAPLAIVTTSPLPAATIGLTYSQTLVAAGGTGVYTWSATGQPAWLNVSAAGVLTGTPPTIGNASFSATVTDTNGVTRSATFAVAVIPPPLVIVTTQLPGSATGVNYSQSLSGTGGQPPLAWDIVAGSLAPGLTLAPSGTISGKPSAVGSFNFTVRLSDSASNAAASKPFTIAVTSGLTIATAPVLPAVTQGIAYTATLSASGGLAPFAWSVASGALPAGLQLDATAKISGTPTAAGSFTFSVKVTDGASGNATQDFSLLVNPAPTIATPSLPDGTQGAAYSQLLHSSGGTAPFAWTVTAGALPPGIMLAAQGALSGNPTASGSFSFTVQVKDSSGATATQRLAAVIAPPLGITTAPALPGGTANVAYSVTLATSGGSAPVTWSLISGSLPPGVSLSPSGLIAGTPSDAASSTFTAQVMDSAGASAAATFSVVIAPPLVIATTILPKAEVNIAYAATLAASGGTPPYTWSLAAGALPSALTLASAGSIQGTPSAAGVTSLTLRCSDRNSVAATAAVQLVIATAPVITTPATLPTGVAGSHYSASLTVSGGVPPFQWAVTAGALPAGLAINAQSNLAGTPIAPGTFSATLTVKDSNNVSASGQFTVIIIDDNPELAINLTRTICGPLSLDAVMQLTVVDSIVDAAGGVAIAAPAADASIQTSTILGTVGSASSSGVRTLEAGNSIFTAPVFVERRQAGCVRFCYAAPGSRTPRRYRSQPDLTVQNVADPLLRSAALSCLMPVFTSVAYGQPGYGQLSTACAVEIRTGAEDGSEMGAFDFLKQPQRADNLRASLDEFLRFGLDAGIFFVT
jgi:Putative Ig domain